MRIGVLVLLFLVVMSIGVAFDDGDDDRKVP